MQGSGLITAVIVVVVLLFVGVILAYVFSTRSSKDKKSGRIDDKQRDDSSNKKEIKPDKQTNSKKTIELKKKQDDLHELGLQLVMDDDRIIPIQLPSSLGRSEENNVEIADPTVSAHHAKVYFDERIGAVCIEDLDSKNGIFIDGKPTRKSVLEDGVRLTLGGVSLTFRDTGYNP